MESRPKSAHRYNVQEQQDVYKEEIARIWKLQYDSLSNPIEPSLTQEDEERARGGAGKKGVGRAGSMLPGVGTPGGRAGSEEEEDNVSVASGPAGGATKVLRIKRLVRLSSPLATKGADGIQIKGKWTSEIVRDPAIIGAYIRQRQLIDEDKIDADQLMPSDDAGKNEIRKKRFVPLLSPPLFVSCREELMGS